MGNTQGSIKLLKFLLKEAEELEELQKQDMHLKLLKEQLKQEEVDREEELLTKTKTCKTCNVEKLLTEYHKDKTRKDDRKSDCKLCLKKMIDERKRVVELDLENHILISSRT